MNNNKEFRSGLVRELEAFLGFQQRKFPDHETLTIDLHCHDRNSDIPDELIGRLLGIPETWLSTDELIEILEGHGCDTFTVTNHNNARSCYELRERGVDVLTGAEFTCQVPDFKTGIHVLAYGFTPNQEKILKKLRTDIYRFQEYTREEDIPTIWAHPLYHHRHKGMPPLEFFDKMALIFERFEVINGQRDTWQNMLVKVWLESLDEETLESHGKKFGIRPDRYCRHPYRKAMAGGSDSHMGIFTGLTGTKLHVKDLAEKLKIMSRSKLALEAIKHGNMAPFGSHNDSEKMMATFLDLFCQLTLNMEDPGLLRLILHKGDVKEKLLAFTIANGIAEIKRHRVTVQFLDLFHRCFTGKVPGKRKRLMVPTVYKAIFDEASHMAVTRRDNPEQIVHKFRESIHSIYDHLNRILIDRLQVKFEKLDREQNLSGMKVSEIFDTLEFPLRLRDYTSSGTRRRLKGVPEFRLSEFLDGLSFPFLGSVVILAAAYASARVMFNSRKLLTAFADRIGKLKHCSRALWLTDTLEDTNGVAMVLKSMLHEIRKRDIPIDLMVCSNTLKSEDHLIVVKPLTEYTFPFYEHQPLRLPNIMDIHRIFNEGEYDRVICSTEGPMGMISLYLKTAYSVPTYFYVHTDWMMFARQVLNFNHENRSMLRRILRAFYRGFDGLFVLNKDQQAWLNGKDMGFDPNKVFLTAHWADEGFSPQKSGKKEIFGVDEDDPVLLFAGRLSDEKGVMELPAVYRSVKESFPNTKIALAGTGPREKDLKEALPDAVFLGWVDHAELPRVYSAADMLILPSKFDTFGCVVLEALSCGLPVTAYNTKGPKDIILHGKNGYLVKTRTEMSGAIKEYLSGKRRQKSFRKAAGKRAEDYDPDVIIPRFLEDVGLAAPDRSGGKRK